jgi:protein-S-isoprenylcysteine O-methyltransferase Ste14
LTTIGGILEIKGLQKLRRYIPDLQSTKGGIKIILEALGIFSFTIFLYSLVNRYLPIWGPDGQIIIITIGFLLMRMFFTHKKAYITNYGQLAYRNALLRFALPGLMVIFASVAYTGFILGPRIPISWWAAITPFLGWYFLIIGITLWLRAFFTFGLDNLTMLYVYFPEKGRWVNNSIYSVIRHPVYAGVLRLGIGLAFLNGNIFAIIFGLLILPFGLTAWIRLVEEKELVKRFGTSYIEYRRVTPAFWPRLRDLIKFFQYLIKG